MRVALPLGALVLFVVAILTLGHHRPPAPSAAAAPATADGREHATAPSPARGAQLPSSPEARARLVLDAAARAHMLAQIASARQHEAPTRPANFAADAPPELDKDYVREQIRELLPLVSECYSHALERNPKLEGRMMVDFSIVGDPSVGGLVGDSKIDGDKSDIADADMRECVQETMYAMKLKAPESNGEIHVSYPFLFKTSAPDEQQ